MRRSLKVKLQFEELLKFRFAPMGPALLRYQTETGFLVKMTGRVQAFKGRQVNRFKFFIFAEINRRAYKPVAYPPALEFGIDNQKPQARPPGREGAAVNRHGTNDFPSGNRNPEAVPSGIEAAEEIGTGLPGEAELR